VNEAGPGGNPFRVHVTPNFPGDGVNITLLIRYDATEKAVIRFGEDGYTTVNALDGMVASAPTMVLPGELATALLDALIRHYQGASDMQTARSDLLHERGRVDKMLDVMSQLVLTATR
jgi:hypothetical protein